jgi:hypothetical protein
MNMVDELGRSQNGEAIAAMAKASGLAPAQVQAVLAAVVPELSRAIERNTLSRGGLADLVNALGQGHHAAILDNPAAIATDAIRDDGNAILGHILGSKDASRGVADRAAFTSGVSASVIKMLLPIIASMLMGALSKQTSGGLGEILRRIGGAGSSPGTPSPSGGGAMPELPRMPHGGGLGGGLPMPQRTPTGQSPPRGASPLPLPGDSIPGMPGHSDNPYGDLSDILRRGNGLPRNTSGPTGGSTPDAPVGGGALWSIVRDIVGGALGFQSRGIVSWIVRMVIMRYGWSLLRILLGGRGR